MDVFLSSMWQEEFQVEYGPKFDQELEKLLWEFLLRLDRLLPVPNLAQVVQNFDAGHINETKKKFLCTNWNLIYSSILHTLSSDCVVAERHSVRAGGVCTVGHPTSAPEGPAAASDLPGPPGDTRWSETLMNRQHRTNGLLLWVSDASYSACYSQHLSPRAWGTPY